MPETRTATLPSAAEIGEILHRLFIVRAGTTLRKEDVQKTHEVAGMLRELSRVRRDAALVDAAAGKASVGLVAAEVLPIGSLVVIERAPDRVAACRDAATRLSRAVPVEVRQGDVADHLAWPDRPDAVVALHACGGASDRVIDQAVRVGTRWLFLSPCCHGASVPFHARALAIAGGLGCPDVATLRWRLATALIETERTLRLEAAGFETEVHEFVGATVTPHNLLLRARRTMQEKRMRDAAEKLARLHGR
ncbi:MAG: methyltransferase [Deltaproteobacteria bacterium]|nr:methyltransferase [Deltaproteobacteria bacterium]